MPPSSWLATFELLTRYGVEDDIATWESKNAFYHWELSELEAIFQRIQRPSPSFSYLGSSPVELAKWQKECENRATRRGYKSGSDSIYFEGWWSSIWSKRKEWLSPPRELMQQAAREKKALCVNKAMQWDLRSGGYAALSHVWIEGLQREETKGGLSVEKLQRVFILLEKAKIDIEWIWTDVLVIPGGGGLTSSLEDEMLTTDIINTMELVYKRAEMVVIIDAMVLQLYAQSLEDIAVVLLLGRWHSRMWTFQESSLANKAVIITATRICTLQDLVSFAATAEASNYNKYHKIWLKLATMSKPDRGISIPDLTTICSTRKAGVEIDYARALFGVLGLKWEYGMTKEQGLQRILNSQKDHATRILFSAGAPRLKVRPAWAPSSLAQLSGVTTEPCDWESRGIRGRWFFYKIRSLERTFSNRGRTVFDFDVAEGPDHHMQCITEGHEHMEVVEDFKKIITAGHACVISPRSLDDRPGKQFGTTVLLAAQAQTSAYEGIEVTVYSAVTKNSLTTHNASEVSMLIRHDGPNPDGQLISAIQHMWDSQKESSRPQGTPLQEGESPLHAAVRSGNLALVQNFLQKGEPILAYDSRGWAPIHVAAVRGESAIFAQLLSAGAAVNTPTSSNNNKETPIHLVAEQGPVAILSVLLNHGADVRARNAIGNTPLMISAMESRADMVAALLANGSDPNSGTDIETALLLACRRGSHSAITALIEAGADVNKSNKWGVAPLHEAAEWGSVTDVRYLLAYDANPRARAYGINTPLYYALRTSDNPLPKVSNVEIVRALLETDVPRDDVFANGWTPIHLAVRSGNWEILQILLDDQTASGRVNIDGRLTDYGWTPLHLAVNNGERIMVKMLLACGADARALDNDGKSVEELAREKGNGAILQILEENLKMRNR